MAQDLSEQNDIDSIATRFRILRTSLGLSANKMAKLCGYSTSYIIKLEKGESNPTPEMLEAVCMSVGCNLAWLADGNGEMIIAENPDQKIGTTDDGLWSERIKSLCADGKMSTRQFGKMIGVTNMSVIRLERGEYKLTLRRAEKIADACGVSINWLMSEDERSKNYPCNSEMIEYLEGNEEVRRYVW